MTTRPLLPAHRHIARIDTLSGDWYRAACSCSWLSPHRHPVWSRANAEALDHIGQQQLPVTEEQGTLW